MEIAKKLLAGRKRKKELTNFPCGGRPVYGRKPEEAVWVWRMVYLSRQGIGLTKLCRKLNYDPRWRGDLPKYWRCSTVAGILKFWINRAEFSEEKMREIMSGPDSKNIFP